MNSFFSAKLLQHLRQKKSANKGFTLIELLVVVIIIGVLAAVALPNLLGQVGKARESEAKTALGALNRAQQAFRLESNMFYGEPAGTSGTNIWRVTETALGVVPGTQNYTYLNSTAAGGHSNNATFTATAVNPDNSGARDFASAVNYASGSFATVVCVATNKATGNARTRAESLVTANADPTLQVQNGVDDEGDPIMENVGACTGGNVIN